MNWNTASLLVLLGLLVALALAEIRFHNHEVRASATDARLVTNFALGAMTMAANGMLPLTNLGSSLLARHLDIGLADHLRSSWTAMFVLTVAAQTLVAYWTHRAMHAAPLFWRVHRVHHADTFVDVSTSLRHHPVELLVTAPAAAAVILLIGTPVSVVLASETFLVAAALWGHADIRLPHRLDRALASVLVTPRVHRVHHSPERHFHDSNFGDTFTVWDRLFGTFSGEPHRMRVGLDGQLDRADNLLDQVLSPLHAA